MAAGLISAVVTGVGDAAGTGTRNDLKSSGEMYCCMKCTRQAISGMTYRNLNKELTELPKSGRLAAVFPNLTGYSRYELIQVGSGQVGGSCKTGTCTQNAAHRPLHKNRPNYHGCKFAI